MDIEVHDAPNYSNDDTQDTLEDSDLSTQNSSDNSDFSDADDDVVSSHDASDSSDISGQDSDNDADVDSQEASDSSNDSLQDTSDDNDFSSQGTSDNSDDSAHDTGNDADVSSRDASDEFQSGNSSITDIDDTGEEESDEGTNESSAVSSDGTSQGESSNSEDENDTNDSSELSPDEDENLGNEYEPFFKHNDAADVLEHVALRNEWRPIDTFYTLLSETISSNKTYDSFLKVMSILNTAHNESKFPKNKQQLWKLITRNRINVKYYVYCYECKSRVGTNKIPTRNCTCGRCGPNKRKQSLGYFTHVSIEAQLRELLNRPNMLASLQYRENRVKRNNNHIDDVYDGVMYQELQRDFLSNRNNYSLTLWMDGVKVAFSSSATAVPILLQLNELSPHARKRHIILAGIWTGIGKPPSNKILKPIVRELARLKRIGINWTPNEGGRNRISRFITCILSCDSDARYDILNMTRFNGFFGCTFCYIEGERDGRRHFYRANIHAQVRTHNDIIRDMTNAEQTGQKVYGVKGFSALAALPGLNLSSGVIVDSMHCIFEGVTKKITNILLANMDDQLQNTVDERLLAIRTPTRLSRRPRSIQSRANWKGSEWKNWILYYAAIVLRGLISFYNYGLLMKLSEATFLLNQSSIAPVELDRAEDYLNQFVDGFQRFGDVNMVYNIHLLRHLINTVRNWGPLWVHSGFQFEAWNQKLVRNVKSANDRGSQIVDRYLIAKFLEDQARSEDIIPAAQEIIKQNLQGARWNVAPLASTGNFFLGQNITGNGNPFPLEIEIIRNSEFQIAEDAFVVRFNSAQIHGATYKVRDNRERDYCNYIFRATTGFYTCEKIISFRNNNEPTISGIIGSNLRTRAPVFGTSYIYPYTPDGQQRFIPYENVISPAIGTNIARTAYVIPLSNCWESD